MKNYTFPLIAVCIIYISFVCSTKPVEAFTLYTMEGFVEALISKGFIYSNSQDRAREIVKAVQRLEDYQKGASVAMNADKVSVSVSQYIEYAGLEYSRYGDIAGLVLIVKNETDVPVLLEAQRECHIVYTISNEDSEIVYDSRNSVLCSTQGQVAYVLEGRGLRVFELTHNRSDKALQKGNYSVEITYPGYGSGTRMIKVL